MNKRILAASWGLALLAIALVVWSAHLQRNYRSLSHSGSLEAESERPLFTFALFSDPHTGGYDNQLPQVPITQAIVQNIITERDFPTPNFLIVSGDLVHHYKQYANGDFVEGNVGAEFRKAIEVFNRLPIPWYPVVGNHDNWNQDYALWDKCFPGKRRYYFVYDEYLFVMFDDFRIDHDCPKAQERREWLRGILDLYPNKLVILVMHYPLIELDPDFPAEYFVRTTANPSVKDIIARYDNIVAVLSGHLHLNRVMVVDGVYHIGTGAVCSYPYPYRYFEVYPDSIAVTTYSINKLFETHGNWMFPTYADGEASIHPEVEDFSIPIH